MVKSRALVAFAVVGALLSGAAAGLAVCCVKMAEAEDHSCCAQDAGFVAAAVSCCPASPARAEKAAPVPTPLPVLTDAQVTSVDASIVDPGAAAKLSVRDTIPASTPPLVLRI